MGKGWALALVLLIRKALDREADVRAVEAADDYSRLAHPQPLDDLLAHRGRCGRCQRQDTRMGERLDDGAEAKVLRTEITSLLTDAVGLVDDDEGRPARLHAGICLLVREWFGRQEEELGRTLDELVKRFPRSAAGKAKLTRAAQPAFIPTIAST